MLRLTTRNRSIISNRLAIFAALMLVISALANTDDSIQFKQGGSGQFAGIASNSIEHSAAQPPGGKSLRKSKGFKMSLFLFRLD